jgi:hypothetical protein
MLKTGKLIGILKDLKKAATSYTDRQPAERACQDRCLSNVQPAELIFSVQNTFFYLRL